MVYITDIVIILIFVAVSIRETYSVIKKKSFAPFIKAKLSIPRSVSVSIMVVILFVFTKFDAFGLIAIARTIVIIASASLTLYNFEGVCEAGIWSIGHLEPWSELKSFELIDIGPRIKLSFNNDFSVSELFFDKKYFKELKALVPKDKGLANCQKVYNKS